MKTTIKLMYAFLILLSVSNCRSDKPTHFVVGNWQWLASSGGIGGFVYKSDPNKRVIVHFSEYGQYTITVNDTLASTGSYELTTAKSIRDHKDRPALQVSNTVNHTPNKPIQFGLYAIGPYVITASTVNELGLSDNFYDGFGHTFRRVTDN